MTRPDATTFELVTWYDTWNPLGFDNLRSRAVPLQYAVRYNLAFGQFAQTTGGYTIDMNGIYAAQVKAAIHEQAPTVSLYAGLGDTGLSATVVDNRTYGNRSTKNIVAYLLNNGFKGIAIDAENDGMSSVAELVAQLGPSFRAAGLGIAVSVPWPQLGPDNLYGSQAVAAFNANVDALELQDYSSLGTPADVPTWTRAGIKPTLLLGGVCSENSGVQTSLADTVTWTQYALNHGLRGMFSWRLDNDHGQDGEHEDVKPTFTGAKLIYDTVHSDARTRALAQPSV